MALSKKQLSEIGGKITLILLTFALGFAAVYYAVQYAETNHEEPPTTYNELGFECSAMEKDD